jgi:hypothetical protein
MLLSNRLTFYEEFSVYLLRFSTQFWPILYSWIRIQIANRLRIRCGSGSETLILFIFDFLVTIDMIVSEPKPSRRSSPFSSQQIVSPLEDDETLTTSTHLRQALIPKESCGSGRFFVRIRLFNPSGSAT